MGRASLTVTFFGSFLPLFIPCMILVTASPSWGNWKAAPASLMDSLGTCIVMVVWSSSPDCSMPCQSAVPLAYSWWLMRVCTTSFSARALASERSFSLCWFLVMVMEMSTRSRMIWSTSRPWNPTSVNFVASTLIKGALASLASLLAISVLPHPVGPIIRMFFGTTSGRSSGSIFRRLYLFLRAMATARFASGCPTMCLSSHSTVCLGVRVSIETSSTSSSLFVKLPSTFSVAAPVETDPAPSVGPGSPVGSNPLSLDFPEDMSNFSSALISLVVKAGTT
mmetsp:Transcript_772/g.1120  ORF Transcript_772/g.1120 Transcript_772/m.1120 type:complete len:280 (+) Transcript_772:808-1647(+)